MKELLYKIPKGKHLKDEVIDLLKSHPEVKFISFVAMDFSGNGTDEKIPVRVFMEEFESLIEYGVQTDGSSVILKNIATLDNAKVAIVPDIEADWYIDYNFLNIDMDTGKPIGTLRIPSFLVHNGKFVCSRSILRRAAKRLKEETLKFINSNVQFRKELELEEEIDEVNLTVATEMEFWVQTPEDKADEEKLSASQTLKEQYWKRTDGIVRTALETTINLMELYGFKPEMGHKEVGGVSTKISLTGFLGHIMEQLEIDWLYDDEISTADKEHFIRHLIKDIFHYYTLEVTFRAKPIENVAGSGKHIHMGVAVKTRSGKNINLFSHSNFNKHFLTSYGYSALMGILKNYEIITPFVSWTIDSINRLKPHFEAPICIVSSLGLNPETPSRNRSVLIGLIKEERKALATRFELRSPNPHNNTYLILAACYQAIVDGINKAGLNMKLEDLESELSKKEDDDAFYLEKDREYRSELNIFENYSPEERDRKFGKVPATVYESMMMFESNKEKLKVLNDGDVFNPDILKSFMDSQLEKWSNQLLFHIIPDSMAIVRESVKLHDMKDDTINELDSVNWYSVNNLRLELMKDSLNKKSLFTQLREAVKDGNFEEASSLQLSLANKIKELKNNYNLYRRNII